MSEITHARLKLPLPQVHAQHPFKDKGNHDKLRDYVVSRLDAESSMRGTRISKFAQIDRDVAGWIRQSKEDLERIRDHEQSGKPQAVPVNLPITFIHIDDMMTYYAQTFAPTRGMFFHSAGPGDAAQASQIVALMNNHAIYSSGYRQLLLAIYACLKYNMGGQTINWGTDYGPKVSASPEDSTKINVTTEAIWSGNKMKAIDMYNFMYDSLVDPTQLYREGEWAAEATLVSHYWLQQRAADGVYFNCEESLQGFAQGAGQCKYYKHPPTESRMNADNSSGATNWMSVLSHTNSYTVATGYELVTMYIRLNPVDFGLIPGTKQAQESRARYEIWRITLLNGETIIEATYMNNVHNYLPFFIGIVNDDFMGAASKSVSETIQPMTNFASFLVNLHIQASRKNLYGTTFYDPSVVDMGAIPDGEVAARVPIKAPGFGKDLNRFVIRETGTLDTKQTLQDLQGVMGIIDQFFPTQSLPSQIAGIDRAISSQVASVQQGSNRRQHKTGRLLDDTMMRPMRFCMYYNIIQYQTDGVTVSDFYGKPVTINLEELRQTDLPFIIGQGLKAIDRESSASAIKELIFAIIQNPAASQQTDVMGLINYWVSLLDLDMDMSQFRRAAPVAAPNQGDVPDSLAPGAPAGPPEAAAPNESAA